MNDSDDRSLAEILEDALQRQNAQPDADPLFDIQRRLALIGMDIAAILALREDAEKRAEARAARVEGAVRRLMWIVIGAILAAALSWPAEAAQKRSQAVAREFQLQAPCPSTGLKKGRCPGYERDHRIPLCFYGPDAVWNLQWLTIQAHREKTRLDVKVCRWDGK